MPPRLGRSCSWKEMAPSVCVLVMCSLSSGVGVARSGSWDGPWSSGAGGVSVMWVNMNRRCRVLFPMTCLYFCPSCLGCRLSRAGLAVVAQRLVTIEWGNGSGAFVGTSKLPAQAELDSSEALLRTGHDWWVRGSAALHRNSCWIPLLGTCVYAWYGGILL